MNDPSHDEIIRKLRESELKRLAALKEGPNNYDGNDPGVLLSDKIRHYSEQFELISPLDEDSLRPAGYDLRVGYNYSILGERKALNEGMHLEIGPYQVAVIETYETLNLPKFLIGRWNVRVKHAYKGLLWVGGAQVDPGFRGRLCCPIYNLSTEPVRLGFKETLAMIDFVTTTHFKVGCELFPWQTRKMLVFPEYPLLNSGIEKQVDNFQKQIRDNSEGANKQIAKIAGETTQSFQDIQARIDNFVVLMFTVVAVLFAGLGIVATKSSESSLVAASFSLVTIAAIALYFALRPYYLISKLAKGIRAQAGQSTTDSIGHFRSLLEVGWTEIVLASLLVLISLAFDGWSVYKVRGSVSTAENAQMLVNQAIQGANAQKLASEQNIKDLRQQYDSKMDNLEREIENLRRTKRDK